MFTLKIESSILCMVQSRAIIYGAHPYSINCNQCQCFFCHGQPFFWQADRNEPPRHNEPLSTLLLFERILDWSYIIVINIHFKN